MRNQRRRSTGDRLRDKQYTVNRQSINRRLTHHPMNSRTGDQQTNERQQHPALLLLRRLQNLAQQQLRLPKILPIPAPSLPAQVTRSVNR